MSDANSVLAITKEQFLQIYEGTKMIDDIDLFYPEQDLLGVDKKKERIAFGRRRLKNKLFRMNTLYYIKDKQGKKVLFKMNHGQHKVFAAGLKHPRLIILKSRQIGISTLKLIEYFDDIITIPHIEVGLVSHGLYAAEKNLEKIKLLWDSLHPAIKGKLKVTSNSTKAFSLSNGTMMYVKGAFRGTTIHRLHVSEYGKIAADKKEVAEEIKSGTLQAVALGNPVVFESTAEGPNDFMHMWNSAVRAEASGQLTPEDFKPVFLSWLDDPACVLEQDVPDTAESKDYFKELTEKGHVFTRAQQNFWIKKCESIGERIYKEYPADPQDAFKASQKGAYFAKIYDEIILKHNRIKENLFDPNLDIYLAMDVGFDDYFVLMYFQIGPNREIRIIHEHKMHHQDLKYYAEYILTETFPDAFGQPRVPEHIWFPHDMKATHVETGKPRIQIMEEYGVVGQVLDQEKVVDGIERTRAMLRNTWIEPRCVYTIDCICNYKKEYSPRLDQFLERPKHDEFSHGGDTLRYMSDVVERELNTGSSLQQTYGPGDIAV